MNKDQSSATWDAVVVGGGLAGVSASIYLGRALRRTLVIDDDQSLARWEPEVKNFLGFPDGIAGEELLRRGRQQAEAHGVEFAADRVTGIERQAHGFVLRGGDREYTAKRVLLATGLYHLPPEIPGVSECLGQSLFFCKDCDAFRVQGHRIAVLGHNNEAVEYSLAMLLYSPCVFIATNGKPSSWDDTHARWIAEYRIPVLASRIAELHHEGGRIQTLSFENGDKLAVDAAFTVRGDVYHNEIARHLGAELDPEGQIVVDSKLHTTVPGLYAAGCVTPANCQMIIAAGQGAAAAQAINRDLFDEDLQSHRLRQFRERQLRTEQTHPDVLV